MLEINIGRLHLWQPLQGRSHAPCSYVTDHPFYLEVKEITLLVRLHVQEPGSGTHEQVAELEAHTLDHFDYSSEERATSPRKESAGNVKDTRKATQARRSDSWTMQTDRTAVDPFLCGLASLRRWHVLYDGGLDNWR